MNIETVCRICKTEGVRLHCITNTYLQQIYEHDSGTSLPTEDNKPLLACITCCDRLQHCYQVSNSCEQRENALTVIISDDEHSNTSMSAISPVEHHNNTCVVQSDEHKCIKMETEQLSEVDVKEETTTDAEADETWQENEVSLKEDNDNTEMGLSPRIVNVKSENDMIDGTGPGDITNEERELRQAIQSITYEDTPDTKNETMLRKLSNYMNDELNHTNSGVSSNSIPVKCKTTRERNKSKSRAGRAENPYECDLCNKRFYYRSHLNTHIRGHSGDKPYKCDVCSKCFTMKSKLLAHNRVHTVDRPFKCSICGKCFTETSKHYRMHISKTHQCNICLKSFCRKSSLSEHNLIHTGDKPHKCTMCNKKFTRKSDLVRHIRIHTGEKPFTCNICSKSFNEKGDLDKHNCIHTGENANS